MEVLSKIPTFGFITKTFPSVNTVLFDMDGTLLDAEPIHHKAILNIMGEGMSFEDLCELGIGKTDDVVLRELQALGFMEGLDYPTFSSLKFGHMIELLDKDKDFKLSLSMMTLIKDIKSAGFKLGLVTSSERDLTEFIFNKLDLNQYFDLIITRNDVEKPKPDPFPYNHAMSTLQSKSSETLILEDSHSGLRAARDSGAFVIKAEWFNE